FDHQDRMPDVPSPEKLTAEEVAKQPMFREMPDFIRRYYESDRPIELPGRTRPLFWPENRRRPHPCLDSHRGQTARRSGAAYVRPRLCVGFLAARCRHGALRPHAVRQADDA